MTINEYVEMITTKKYEQFKVFCEVGCRSTVDEVKKILLSPNVSFNLVMNIIKELNEECYIGDIYGDDSVQIEPVSEFPTFIRLRKGVPPKFSDFMSFADSCLDMTGECSHRVLRSDLYDCYVEWCSQIGKEPNTDKSLYKWLRENYIEMQEEWESIEYRDNYRKRGFKGIKVKPQSEWFEREEIDDYD